MIEKLIYRFVDSLSEYNNYNEEQVEQIKYSLKVIVYELIKIILLIIIFSILGYFKVKVY